MVAIKNIESKDLELAFEGQTYFFPKGSIVLVEPNVVEFMKELWPLAFEYDVALPKGEQVSKVKVVKTKSFISPSPASPQDMKATFAPDFETQGADFYGAGIEEDKI